MFTIIGTGVLMLMATVWLMILWQYRGHLMRLWREPVIRWPIIIFESDDWGPGPEAHAEALNRLCAVLCTRRDRDGSRPVVTLGVVLATADIQRMDAKRVSNIQLDYYRKDLCEPEFASIRKAIRKGQREKVFSPQLHGMEHFWPPALCQAGTSYPEVVDWLQSSPPADAQQLPSHLQSRWVNAATLPSLPIPPDEIENAAQEETAMFKAVFGFLPRVAVPPTFVWDNPVEAAWSNAGIGAVITPGIRYTQRNAEGQPDGATGPIYSGERTACGAIYLVRDVYFEPGRGHTAEFALDQIRERTHLKRPALIEMHRDNFTGDSKSADRAFCELEHLLELIQAAFPEVRFMSAETLAERYRIRDAECFDTQLRKRLHVWLTRVDAIPRLHKLSLLSGLFLPAALLWAITR